MANMIIIDGSDEDHSDTLMSKSVMKQKSHITMLE